jgi:hypothetical protein
MELDRLRMKPLTNHLQLIMLLISKKLVVVYIGQERIGEGNISQVNEQSVKIGEERLYEG